MIDRKMRLLFVIIYSIVGCSGPSDELRVKSRFTLTQEDVERINFASFESRHSGGPNKIIESPSTIGSAGYNCLGLMVTYPGVAESGRCLEQTSGDLLFAPSEFFGFFDLSDSGVSFEVDILSLDSVEFNIVILRSELSTGCPSLDDDFSGPHQFFS